MHGAGSRNQNDVGGSVRAEEPSDAIFGCCSTSIRETAYMRRAKALIGQMVRP